MKKTLSGLAVAVLAAAAAALASLPAQAAPADRWLHVKVEDSKSGEKVRVNIPLRVAEQVLPAIHVDVLQNGRIKVREIETHGVDLRALLEAVRGLDDGEFVTVESKDETVRVSKEGGYLIARMQEQTGSQDDITVKVPFALIDALLSGEPDELNILAAVRKLNELGDEVYVHVTSRDESVRVWVDSKKTME